MAEKTEVCACCGDPVPRIATSKLVQKNYKIWTLKDKNPAFARCLIFCPKHTLDDINKRVDRELRDLKAKGA